MTDHPEVTEELQQAVSEALGTVDRDKALRVMELLCNNFGYHSFDLQKRDNPGAYDYSAELLDDGRLLVEQRTYQSRMLVRSFHIKGKLFQKLTPEQLVVVVIRKLIRSMLYDQFSGKVLLAPSGTLMFNIDGKLVDHDIFYSVSDYEIDEEKWT